MTAMAAARGRTSAGVLLYRRADDGLEVLIGHMGGPFWARKDDGGWSIPKGEYDDGEDPRACALREFEEETGTLLSPDELAELGDVRLKSGKPVTAWAVEGDLDADAITSNEFEVEWPPRSGRMERYPECEQARWMSLAQARRLMLPSQLPLLDALEAKLDR